MKTYTIDYRIITKTNTYHPDPEKVEDCMNELFAKLKLEKIVQPKYVGYVRMEVISCTEGFLGNNIFSDIFSGFKSK